MPILIQTTHGKVIAMQGSALIRGADGKMRALHVGDIVERGDVILTTQNGIVEMKPEAGPNVAATPVANDIDRVITGLNEDNPATATAATLAGDGAGDLSPGLRVDRVVELASASALTQSSGIATGPLPFAGTNTINQTTTPVLTAGSSLTAHRYEGARGRIHERSERRAEVRREAGDRGGRRFPRPSTRGESSSEERDADRAPSRTEHAACPPV